MSEPFIGSIVLFAGSYAPRGWALCNGQLLAISQNQALFAILGTTYGGNGTTTFALPDLRGRVPAGVGQGPGLSPYSLGQNGGSESVTLVSQQMPAHTHAVNAANLTVTLRGVAGSNGDATAPASNRVLSKFTGPANVNLYSDSDANLVPLGGTQITASVQNAGGNQGHENRQPLLTVNYIIALTGIFPSQT